MNSQVKVAVLEPGSETNASTVMGSAGGNLLHRLAFEGGN